MKEKNPLKIERYKWSREVKEKMKAEAGNREYYMEKVNLRKYRG